MVVEVLRRGWEVDEVFDLTAIDPWFLHEMQAALDIERRFEGRVAATVSAEDLWEAKRAGIADTRLAALMGCREDIVEQRRKELGLTPVYKRVDTCAAEFESFTPYLYSTYEDEDEAGESPTDRVVILGNGPNRIGQGLEFDYACCHAAFAVRDAGLTSVMVNCNPETVSTDYDTSDKLYFEPIDREHVQAVLDREQPRGVILQFGGQTPLKLSHHISPVLGTSPDAIDLCEDRARFNAFCNQLGVRQPEGATANSLPEAAAAAARIGFPLLVRPSYVLGGRAMHICYDDADFDRAAREAMVESGANALLLDHYLDGAIEYDVDALSDGHDVYIGGIIEHIEEAGVHSGDSSGVLPPVRLPDRLRKEMEETTRKIALALGVVGLVNIQYAVLDGLMYVIEVNPRASRTVPFVSKAIGVPLARIATQLCLGTTLAELEEAGHLKKRGQSNYFIKAPVFPWRKFPGSDVILGPEMRSTGEVMGVGWAFGEAYAKALIAAGLTLPTGGAVFISVRDEDKPGAVGIAGSLAHMGFQIYATTGTANYLKSRGVECERVFKVAEGRPDIVDHIKNGKVQLMLNTPRGKKAKYDERAMRLAGLRFGVPCITTLAAAKAVVSAIRSLRADELQVIKLQEIV